MGRGSASRRRTRGRRRCSTPSSRRTATSPSRAASTTRGWSPYRFDVRYDWSPEPQTFEGSVFTDRGLYQAGETVHLKAILRQKTDGDWTSVTDSVRVRITSPREEVVLDERFLPSDWGTFPFDYAAPESADQGVYRVRVGLAGDTTSADADAYDYGRGDLAWGTFRVDAFRRAGFAVTARTSADEYVAGDFFEGSLEGRYLFGAAMGGQPASYRLERTSGYHRPPGYDGYHFGGYGYGYGQTLAQADTVLGDDGAFRVRVPLPGNEEGTATRLTWSGTVTDPARQEGAGRTSATLHPGLFYIGLRPKTGFLDLTESQTMAVDVIAGRSEWGAGRGGRPPGAGAAAVEQRARGGRRRTSAVAERADRGGGGRRVAERGGGPGEPVLGAHRKGRLLPRPREWAGRPG